MKRQKILVPTKLGEITLGQYQKFIKISEGKKESEFLHKKMIEIFCSIDLKDVDKIKYTSIKRIIGILNEMFLERPKLITRFKMNNIDFGFIPKLDNMTFAEFVDLDLLLQDWETFDQAMSVLYRKVVKENNNDYLIEEYNSDKQEFMGEMPLDVALSAVFFLMNLSEELTMHTLSYSQKIMMNLTQEQKQNLTGTGDGTEVFTHLQKGTLLDSLK